MRRLSCDLTHSYTPHHSSHPAEKELIVLAQHDQETVRREVNLLQKEIGTIKKAKGDAAELLVKKGELDKRIAELTAKSVELVKKRDQRAGLIGNIVDKNCHVSMTEVCFLYLTVSGRLRITALILLRTTTLCWQYGIQSLITKAIAHRVYN